MKNQITIKDIANELKIHHTTVSRALRNHPDVNKETRKKILEKAKEMHYVPNTFATGLRNNISKTIGIMVPDITPRFFSNTISHITNLAHAQGYSVMIFQSNEDVMLEKKNVTALIQNRIAGLIVSLSRNTEDLSHFKSLEIRNIPVVYFDRIPVEENVDKIQINNFQAGFEATMHLIKAGRKRIAFYSGKKNVSVFSNRLKGYIEAIKQNSNYQKEKIFRGGRSFEEGYNTAKEILKEKELPDAIICAVDQMAFGMIKAFNQAGIKIPEQIAIMGFDNDSAGKMVQPSLTTMAQPLEIIAKKAFSILLQRINSDDALEVDFQHENLNMSLIKRESTP